MQSLFEHEVIMIMNKTHTTHPHIFQIGKQMKFYSTIWYRTRDEQMKVNIINKVQNPPPSYNQNDFRKILTR